LEFGIWNLEFGFALLFSFLAMKLELLKAQAQIKI